MLLRVPPCGPLLRPLPLPIWLCFALCRRFLRLLRRLLALLLTHVCLLSFPLISGGRLRVRPPTRFIMLPLLSLLHGMFAALRWPPYQGAGPRGQTLRCNAIYLSKARMACPR